MTITEAQFKKFPEKDVSNRVLEGTAYFAWLSKPKHSDKFKNDEYIITLGLSDAERKKAEGWGLEVKEPTVHATKPEYSIPEPYVEIRRKIRPGKTFEECKPDVVDAVQQPIPDAVVSTIGNGSKVLCKFATYFNGEHARTTLFKVQVMRLVPFVGGGSGLKMDDTGYKANGTDSAAFDA